MMRKICKQQELMDKKCIEFDATISDGAKHGAERFT